MRYNNLKRHNADFVLGVVGKCPKCGNDVVLRKTSYGNFENCSNYPQCRYIVKKDNYTDEKSKYNVKKNDKGQLINELCPQCGGNLLLNSNRRGKKFIGCENYPQCKYARWCDKNDENLEINDSNLCNTKNSISNIKEYDDKQYSSKFKKGIRDDIEQDVMSSWEANIIRLFNYLKIEYKYESDSFNLGKSECDYRYVSFSYVPDFVLNDGTLIEVKGNLDYRSLQNIRRFNELYPNEKLVIIDSDIYYLLDKKYGNIVPNWEKSATPLTCYVTVVGITFKERKQYVDKLKDNDEIYLVRELDNKYDKNAIKVVDKDNNHLGYISGDYACYYAPKMDKGIKYKLIVKERKEKVLNCAISPTNLDSYDVSDYLDIFK